MAATRRAIAGLLAGGGLLAAWGLFEAQWVETRVRRVPVAGLPPELEGFSILHLSDFHAGNPSLNMRAMQKAIAFGVQEQPDMVVVTGDIITHPRGAGGVLAQLARLDPPDGMFAALGNHDTGATRDPFSRGYVPDSWGDTPLQLLRDRSVQLEARGVAVEVAGMDPDPWPRGDAAPHLLFRSQAPLRILLAHFPEVVDALPAGSCSLVLAGHLHGGQICLPRPGGRIRLSHAEWPYLEGVHRVGGTTLVVSRGTGTTLVPFRLLARPEVSLLRLTAG